MLFQKQQVQLAELIKTKQSIAFTGSCASCLLIVSPLLGLVVQQVIFEIQGKREASLRVFLIVRALLGFKVQQVQLAPLI